MNSSSDSRAPQRAGRARHQPRRPILFLVSAAVSVVALCWSLFGLAAELTAGEAAVREEQGWSERRDRYSTLAMLAAAVNAPGNDVFESRDTRGEHARMEAALARFNAESRLVSAKLMTSLDDETRGPAVRQLDHVDRAMERVASEARLVFALFATGEEKRAQRSMAAMDRESAALGAALRTIQHLDSDAMKRVDERQLDNIEALRRYERTAVLGTLLLVWVAIANDRRNGRSLTASLQSQVRQLDALQQSEEQLRVLTSALEERVAERTAELADANALLSTSETELRTLIESMSDVIVLFGDDGTYRKVFETGTQTLIRTPSELRGSNIRDVLPPATLEYVRGKIAEVLDAGTPLALDYGISVRERELWFRGVASPVGGREVLWVARDVTERKLAEVQLARRETQLSESQRIAHVGCWEGDLSTRVVEWSDETYRICGVDRSGFAPTLDSYFALVHPDDRAGVEQLVLEGRRTGNPYRTEHRIVRPDGSIVAIVGDVQFVREGDTLVRVFGVLQDVTDRVAARDALRAQQSFLRQVLDAIPSLIFVKDREGRFTLANQATAEALGVTTDDLVGRSDADFGHTAEELAAFRREDLAVLECGAPVFIAEESITDAAGRTRWLQTVKVPIVSAHDGADQVLGVSTDISDRRNAERRVRESEQQLANAQRLASLGNWQWNIVSGEVTWSAETYRQLGYEWPNVVPAFDLVVRRIHPEDRETFLARTQQSAETGEPLSVELRYLYDDGSIRHIDATGEVTRDDDGRAILITGTALDVTEQVQAEATLREARAAAEAASEAKSAFLANVSHEIRTPMNGVLGMLEIALDDDLAPELRDCLQTAHASAESLLGVISDILDFSKIEAGQLSFEPVPFSLRDSVADAMSALAVAAHQKGLELAFETAPDVPDALVGDQNRLRQVIVNLVGNATKFTAEGEVVVRVAVDAESADDSAATLLHFTVSDTGIGIAPEKQTLIFDAFQQADTSTTREFGGTGLGLTIVARLVALMGGRVWVESERSKGSTFHFTARFQVQPSALLVADSESDTRSGLDGMRVLVVDDNRTNGEILVRMLHGWGMQPTLAVNGFDAIAKLDEVEGSGHGYGMLLIDADMPEMDGFALVEALGGRTAPHVSTVMLLGASHYRDDAARCRALGVGAYLAKPAPEAQLRKAVRAAAGAERPIGGHERRSEQPSRTRAAHAVTAPLRILLAEDHRVNQKLACALLERAGHTVIVVENGREAVAAAASDRFDLVLMDVHMPEMGGLEAAAGIRRYEVGTGGHVPIIAVTARAMVGDRDTCLAAGMDEYLLKPINAKTLAAVIAKTMSYAPSTAPTPASTRETIALPAQGDAGRTLDEGVFGERQLVAMVGGDRELVAELVELFQRDYPGQLATIRAALEAGDGPMLEFTAHALKGAAATLQAPGVAAAALQLEEAARRYEVADAVLMMPRLEAELAALDCCISKCMGSCRGGSRKLG